MWCWQGCKQRVLLHLAGENVTWYCLLGECFMLHTKILNHMLFDPATLLLGIYLTDIVTNIWNRVFRNVKTKAWKQLKSLSCLWGTYEPRANDFSPHLTGTLTGTHTLQAPGTWENLWRIPSSSPTNFTNSSRRLLRFPSSQKTRRVERKNH